MESNIELKEMPDFSERDIYLTKAIGGCCHALETDIHWDFYKCKLCSSSFEKYVAGPTNFSKKENFWLLWEYVFTSGEVNVPLFVAYCQQQIDCIYSNELTNFPISLIEPNKFADAVYNYLKIYDKEIGFK